MAQKKSVTPNFAAYIYDGGFFSIDFGCVGTEVCSFAICQIMPPDGSEECVHKDCGDCRNPHAQCAAIEALMKRLKKELKQRISEGED